ncbi:hypothetical protein FQA39_LY08276 [Lamprigera yunnana]|nr:hypothetical protein FQA39_LY08276 [Lamprigera yunnana]
MSFNESLRNYRESDEYHNYKREKYSSRGYKMSSPDGNHKIDAQTASENNYYRSSKDRSYHRKSEKYRKHKYTYDDYDREFVREKGRYHKEQSCMDRLPRGSSSYKKHRYNKIKSLSELSSKYSEIEEEYLKKNKKHKTDYREEEEWHSTLKSRIIRPETNKIQQELHEFAKSYVKELKLSGTAEQQEYSNQNEDENVNETRNSDTMTGSETSDTEQNKIEESLNDQQDKPDEDEHFLKDSTPELNEDAQSEESNNEPLQLDELEEMDEGHNEVDLDDLPPYYPAIQGCRSVNEFQLLNHINEGTYGVVYRARDKHNNDIVALKRLKMEKEKEGFPITSLREINTLLKGQHPNIVTVREIVVGNNMDKIFIVMDYLEHDLKSLIEIMRGKKQSFTAAEVKCLMKQLLCAIAYLHDNWILHRDLKTSNLLLSQNGILKVGDFGLAREYGSPLKVYTPIVVTLWYRAPELLLGIKPYSTTIDVWSVGCIFGELALMNAVFPGKSEIDELHRIFKLLGTPNKNTWPGFNKIATVQKIKLVQYPNNKLSQRFNMLSVQGQTLLQQLLTCDPNQRITAEDAHNHPYFNEFPLALEPSSFPSWPTKADVGQVDATDLKRFEENVGFRISASSMDNRKLPLGGGFNLKF